MSRSRRRDRPLRVRPRRAPTATAPTPTSEMACFTCHLSLDHELRRLPPADRGQLEDHEPQLRGRGDAQLRHLQPAGRARRHVPAGPAPDHQGQHHRAGPLVLGADPVLDQHQPRADLRAAAADLGVGLLQPGLRAALPAHGAHDRDQELHATATSRRPTTTTRSWRSCCCWDQLRQLRRPAMPGSGWKAGSRRCA